MELFKKTNYAGINYAGHALNVNRDTKTGIRYGVIHQNNLLQVWCDESEADYGEPTCPECSSELKDFPIDIDTDMWKRYSDYDSEDYVCEECHLVIGSESVFSDEPLNHYIMDSDYHAISDSYGDISIIKSPYFTYAQFCSPCCPGACHLENPLSKDAISDNNKCYCFGHAWFDNGYAPYDVYSVETGKIVKPE